MFILCPQCQFLVAIEPATGLPPSRCPRCGHALRADDAAPGTTTPRAAAATLEEDVVAPADTVVVDADMLAEASTMASVEADWAAELTSPAPGTAAPSPEPAPSAPANQAEPADVTKREKPERLSKSEKRAKAATLETSESSEKTEKRAKPGKVAKAETSDKPPKPGKPANNGNAAHRARHAKPATPKPEPPAEALRHDATPPASAVPPMRRGHAPSFAQARTAPATTMRWPTIATLAGLALLLVLQVLLADRARLAADARWRPALETLCGVLHCRLPPWHEPDAFALVARDVRPLRSGVLRVSATFRNDARWTQAWPALHVALQDVDGRTVGARVFAPSEYLGPRQTQNGLASGQVASVAFDIAEPGGTVVAFTFDFR